MSADVPVGKGCAKETQSPSPGQPKSRPVRGYAILPRPDAPYSIDPDTAGTTWHVVTPDDLVLAVIYASKVIGHGAEMMAEAGGEASCQILGLGCPRLPLTRPGEDDLPLPLGWSDVLAEVAALLEREGWVCLCNAEQLHDAYARALLVAPLMEERHAALVRAEAAEAERDDAPFIAARDTLRVEVERLRAAIASAANTLPHWSKGALPHISPAERLADDVKWSLTDAFNQGCAHPPSKVVVTPTLEPVDSNRPPTLTEAAAVIGAWLPELTQIHLWFTDVHEGTVAAAMHLPGLTAPAFWASDQQHRVRALNIDGSTMSTGPEWDQWKEAWSRLYHGRPSAPEHVWRWRPQIDQVKVGGLS